MAKEASLVMEKAAWGEVQNIIKGESTLPDREQAFMLWFAKETIEEFLQYPSDVKRMSRETGLGMNGREIAENLLLKITTTYENIMERVK